MKPLISTAALLAAACTMGWTRPNTSDAEFRRDSFECEQEAVRMYPVITSQPSAPAATEMRCRTLYGQTQCTSTPTPTASATYDVNGGNRVNARVACLRARGYTLQTR